MILSYGYRKYMKTNRSRTYTLFFFFFFKQKTAYEIVSGDWSSTCALPISRDDQVRRELRCLERLRGFERLKGHGKIGRASCRERVTQCRSRWLACHE